MVKAVKAVNLTILTTFDQRTREMIPNPFQPAPGSSPPLLVGRHAEISTIEEAIDRATRRSAPTPLALFGLRGIGKTALLNEIADRIEPKGVHLAIEAQEGTTLSDSIVHASKTLLKRIERPGRRIVRALEDLVEALPKPTYELPHDGGAVSLKTGQRVEEPLPATIVEALVKLNDAAALDRKYLAVTIDELHNADLQSLRSTIAAVHQSAGGKKPMLFACAGLPQAKTRLIDKLNTYVGRWDTFDLSFLTPAEATVGIRKPSAQAGVRIDDDVVAMLVEESAGYPAFLQKYASAVWRCQERKCIRVSPQLREIIDQTRETLERTYYARDLLALPLRERAFVVGLARLGPGPHHLGHVARELGMETSAELGSTRMRLVRKGVIFVPAAGSVQFRIPLTERYVVSHLSEILPISAEPRHVHRTGE